MENNKRIRKPSELVGTPINYKESNSNVLSYVESGIQVNLKNAINLKSFSILKIAKKFNLDRESVVNLLSLKLSESEYKFIVYKGLIFIYLGEDNVDLNEYVVVRLGELKKVMKSRVIKFSILLFSLVILAVTLKMFGGL